MKLNLTLILVGSVETRFTGFVIVVVEDDEGGGGGITGGRGAREVEAPSRRVEDATSEEVEAKAICAERWTVSMKPEGSPSRCRQPTLPEPSSCRGIHHRAPRPVAVTT